jgi:molybdate transport system substrate-binding protein
MTLVSEILPVKGIELVGPVPKELQSYVSFRGGVSANAKNAEAARAVVKFFTSSKAGSAYKARGLEPAH